jgi:c-di-GMP-binding flagellar brake protein YcgR
MPSSIVLNIFNEPQPVTASWTSADGERVQAYGVAQLTEMPFLKVQFPKSNLNGVQRVERGTGVVVCFEVDHTVLTLHTTMVEATNHGALLLKIEQHEHKRQKRIATRVPVQGVWAEYRPLEAQAETPPEAKGRADVVNISKTGVLMRLREVVEPNQRVELTLHLSELRLINCNGRVVRLALQRSGEIEAAVQFEDLNNSGRAEIDNYVA